MRLHSVVQPAPVSVRGLPGAENYRVEARQRLGGGVDESEPQLWIHGNGQLGDKLAWILDKFYDRPVAPLGRQMKHSLKEVERGLAPFSNRE